MKIFFGAAIQGHQTFGERREIYVQIIETLQNHGAEICTEHTTGRTPEECRALQKKAIGPRPENEGEALIFVRNKMIEFVEGDIDACVFEVSTPSLGTGIEFAHAYLRPRLGLRKVPVLALYEKGHWPNRLSTMIRGLNTSEFDHVHIHEYGDRTELSYTIENFYKNQLKK